MRILNPNLVIPIEVQQYNEYIKWIGTLEFRVWSFLVAYIIRSPRVKTGTLGLYNKYFMKEKLVARWSQEKIAKALGSDKSAISKAIDRLHKKGYLIKHKIRRGRSTVCVYELGKFDFENDTSYLYAIMKLKSEAAANRKKRLMLSSKQHDTLLLKQL